MSKKLTLYSDFICPFCFIAEQTTIPVLLRDHPDIEFEWVGFELHPETPPNGLKLEATDDEAAQELRRQLLELAQEFGLGEVKAPEIVVNTMAAHALCEYARDQGKLTEVRRALMDALWLDSLDIGTAPVLAKIAEDCGLDGEEAAEAAFDHEYRVRVIQNRSRGYAEGVTGTPMFVVGDNQVVGCQGIADIETGLFKAS